MDVEQLATLRAHIDLENDVGSVLAKHGVEQTSFLAAEAALVDWLADAIDRGDVEKLNAYRIAYERVRGPATITEQPIETLAAEQAAPFEATRELDIRAIAAALNSATPFTTRQEDLDPDETAQVNVRAIAAGLRAALPFDAGAEAAEPHVSPEQQQSGATIEGDLRALREHWAREVEKQRSK